MWEKSKTPFTNFEYVPLFYQRLFKMTVHLIADALGSAYTHEEMIGGHRDQPVFVYEGKEGAYG